jgi:hypothetical protein
MALMDLIVEGLANQEILVQVVPRAHHQPYLDLLAHPVLLEHLVLLAYPVLPVLLGLLEKLPGLQVHLVLPVPLDLRVLRVLRALLQQYQGLLVPQDLPVFLGHPEA